MSRSSALMKLTKSYQILVLLSGLVALAASAGAQTQPDPARFPAPVLHPRSVHDRVFDVWRNPGRFTKNPDIIELPTGRLMLVYSDTEKHFSIEDQHLIILVSDDQGKTWRKHAVVDSHDIRKGEERLVTPRLSILKDGRLIVLIDQDDWGHYHEDQPSGIMAYWSDDNGDTWSKPQLMPSVKGFEPDRVMDLPDGTLGFAAQVMLGESQEFAEILYVSSDKGRTWKKRAVIAHDGFHRFCEGAIVELNKGKELACVLRENHSAGLPSFVAFSKDSGRTWSKPEMLPFAFHRPYAKQLPDGRVLVTGRNVLGGLGTYGWVGDLKKEAGRYEIGGPAAPAAMQLTPTALVIENKPGHEARFSFLPPESSKSEVVFSARVKVEGPAGVPVAFLSLNRIWTFRGAAFLKIAPDGIWMTEDVLDEKKVIDMTQYREIAIHLKRGLMQVYVDDRIAFSVPVFWESATLKDFLSNDPTQRTQFGQLGDVGTSFWERVTYRVFNPTQPAFVWQWLAKDGKWPDQYQRDRLIQIHSNPIAPKHRPDHGYTSWLTLKDGRILFVDYSNRGDELNKSHLVGVYLTLDDLKDKPSGEEHVLKRQ